MKSAFYFTHDYNTRNDIKIKMLLLSHGYLGYGLFWALVEELYNNANALPLNYDCIAYELRCDKSIIQSIINDFGLFEINDGFFSSSSIERRLKERKLISEKARRSANYRWGNANALQTDSDGNAIKERKVKEIKRNEKDNIMSAVPTDTTAPDLKVATPNPKGQEIKTKLLEDVTEVIEIFNAVTGKKCLVNKSRTGKINKLLKAGYTKSDFRAVIEMKYRDWSNDEKMSQYLTPDTIFGEEKFTKYIEQVRMPVVKPIVERKMVY